MKTRSKNRVSAVSLAMYLGTLASFKQSQETEKKKAKQRDRVNKSKEERKKKTFPLVFISSTLENFPQSAENIIDPFFKKSDI